MPNLIDIAQRFVEQPSIVLLYEERCLAERDLSASCAQCAEACPVDAIVVGQERGEAVAPAADYGSVTKNGPAGPRIDDEACVRCGRCVTACPTGALLAVAPMNDDALLDAAARAGAASVAHVHADGTEAPQAPEKSRTDCDARTEDPPPTAGFVCERAARTSRVDAERTVMLPCLAWVDEALIVHLACAGAGRVELLAAPCATCEYAPALAHLPATVRSAQRILEAWDFRAIVSIVQTIDDVSAQDDTEAVGEVSRRGLFSQARSALVDAATDAAAAQVEALAGKRTADAPPPKPDRRRWQLLDDLHAANLPASDTLVPRALAPRVNIRTERCSGCALCAEFCPTHALRKVGKASGGRTLLEFDATLCRDCGTCTDTCRYGAISREESLTVSELFALEPRAIIIPKRRVLPSQR